MSRILIEALQTIARLSLKLQKSNTAGHSKADKTVVSMADYFVQAAITHALLQQDPGLRLLGEETISALEMLRGVEAQVDTLLEEANITSSSRALLGVSSHVYHTGEYWILDPIDGTRGFLRGDHYAIALARIEHGTVTESYLVCPHLKMSDQEGLIFASTLDRTQIYSIFGKPRCSMTPSFREADTQGAILIESLELGPATQSLTETLKAQLGWRAPTMRMDSQSKYGALALDLAHCYLRLPRNGAREYAWDHAAGAHLVSCMGGTVTDLDGRPLDFSTGAQLDNNKGILATRGVAHSRVLEALNHIQVQR